jgi:hypothetical protein
LRPNHSINSGGASGCNGGGGDTIEDFEADLKNNLFRIWSRISSGSYFPPPVKAVAIPKKNGGNTFSVFRPGGHTAPHAVGVGDDGISAGEGGGGQMSIALLESMAKIKVIDMGYKGVPSTAFPKFESYQAA